MTNESKAGLFVGIIMLIVAIGLSSLAVYNSESISKSITYIVSIFAVCATIYAAFHIGASLRLNAHQAKVTRSFELLKDLREIGFSKLQATVESKVNFENLSPSQLSELIEKDQDLSREVKQSLAVYGHVSIALQNGYADEVVLYQALDTTVPYLYKTLFPYIEFVRKARNNNGVYSQFVLLATSWISNRYLSNGKTITPNE